jgi:DNA-binding response OmpR family regulator
MAKSKTRLLIAEDDTFLAYILAIRFRQAGFNALSADSLEEAWGQLTDFRPDVVIAGIKLGKHSGYDLLDRVRQWEAETGRQAKVVMLDRLREPAEYDRSRSVGADGYIAKTAASFADMLTVINRVLGGK